MAKAVVLHDQVSYTHFDHQGDGIKHLAPGQSRALQFAKRGDVLHTGGDEDELKIDERELTRLERLGAVTLETNSKDAKLAQAGQPPLSAQRRLPYVYLNTEREQINAMKGASAPAGGVSPRSTAADLSKLDVSDLKVMASAFGYGDLVEGDADKETLIEALTGNADDATSAEDAKAQEHMRDQAQLAAREHGGQDVEPGLLGTNVMAGGRDATTGELPETPKKKGRRSSKAQSDAKAQSDTTAGDTPESK